MIIVSNNLLGKMPVDESAIIRINLAWIEDYETAQNLISSSTHEIYLDYPDWRKKPPRGKISLAEAIRLAHDPKVKYFAVSNCEDIWKIKGIINELPDWVEFVPKIETETGVNNMSDMESIGIKTFMLDAEDLWTDVRANSNKFESLKLKVINFCKDGDCKLLILRGVIFS